jgi:hypothetical protein
MLIGPIICWPTFEVHGHCFKTQPGPTGRPRPGRPGPGIGPGLSKNQLGIWPGKTWSTREPEDPGKPSWDPIYIYINCVVFALFNNSREIHKISQFFQQLHLGQFLQNCCYFVSTIIKVGIWITMNKMSKPTFIVF